MKFEWDENKNEKNIKKHGVDFNEAATVFYDENALYEFDDEHSIHEQRFKIIGMSNHSRIIVVFHCIRIYDVIRIISARPLKNNEIINYKKKLGGRL